MAKEKQVKVEEVQEEVQAEAVQEKAVVAFIVAVAQDGSIQVQDGFKVFGEETVERDAKEGEFESVIKTLNKNIEVAELTAAVKAELARTMTGGR